MKTERARPIGYADPRVIEKAYALSKAKSESDASAIMHDVPANIYSALAKHVHEHRNLFLPEVQAAITKTMASPEVSKAEALFS